MDCVHSHKKFVRLPETLAKMVEEDLSLLKPICKDQERWLFFQMSRHGCKGTRSTKIQGI